MVTLYVKRNARGCWMNSVMAGMASAPGRFATTTGETGFRRGKRAHPSS
jgi:hypothetical protein